MKKYISELNHQLGGKPKTISELKAKGLLVYKIWRQENLHGHLEIGKLIIIRYKLTDEDMVKMKRERWNKYERLKRVKLKLKQNGK